MKASSKIPCPHFVPAHAKMIFIDKNNAKSLLGSRFPGGIQRLVKNLDEYLNFLLETGDTLPLQLLEHNASITRNRGLSEFAKVDADIVIESDPVKSGLSIDLRDYRDKPASGRDYEERRVVVHIVIKEDNKTTWAVHLPLQSIMVGFGNPEEGYQCYAHTITFLDDDGLPVNDELSYCGITSRGWLKRMSEHFTEIEKGGQRKFHKNWRKYMAERNILLNSELIALNHSYIAAMDWEEWIVERYMSKSVSLNMIPGGFKGLRYLGHLRNRIGKDDKKQSDACQYGDKKQSPRDKSDLMANLWRDDGYYRKVIGNRKTNFSYDQVVLIRLMDKFGVSIQRIADHFKVDKLQRIENVISGKYYGRMK